MGSSTSALVLPWVHEHTGIELCIYVSGVWVLCLVICFIYALSEDPSLVKYVSTVEVLVRGLWEIVIAYIGILTNLVLNHSIVEVVCIGPFDDKIIANKVPDFALTITKRSFLEV